MLPAACLPAPSLPPATCLPMPCPTKAPTGMLTMSPPPRLLRSSCRPSFGSPCSPARCSGCCGPPPASGKPKDYCAKTTVRDSLAHSLSSCGSLSTSTLTLRSTPNRESGPGQVTQRRPQHEPKAQHHAPKTCHQVPCSPPEPSRHQQQSAPEQTEVCHLGHFKIVFCQVSCQIPGSPRNH